MKNTQFYLLSFKNLKTRTALSCLTGAVLFYSATGSDVAAQTTSTATITVSASIAASCTITTAPLAFGTYNPGGADTTGTATITATCTNGTAYTINFNDTPDGVTSGTYKLYSAGTSAAATSLWLEASFGATSGFTNSITNGNTYTISGTGNGSAQSKTLYGKIASGQTGRVATAFSQTLTLNLVY